MLQVGPVSIPSPQFLGPTPVSPFASVTADFSAIDGSHDLNPTESTIPDSASTLVFSLPADAVAAPVPIVPSTDELDFSDIRLISSVDVSRIRDRWLDFYLAPSTKQVKPYTPSTVSLISRTLQSYPSAWLRNPEHPPPFMHAAQCSPPSGMPRALSNCLSLLRLLESRAPGSEGLVQETVRREMSRLAAADQSPPHNAVQPLANAGHLAALAKVQAFLLLTIQAYFARAALPGLFQPSMISGLQELASGMSATGLVCGEELDLRRVGGGGAATAATGAVPSTLAPTWEAWIVAECKRRVLTTVYYLENVYNFNNGAPSYVGAELAPLPAPCSKWLWHAKDRRTWTAEWTAETRTSWDSGRLVMSDFWPRAATTTTDASEHGASDAAKNLLPHVEAWSRMQQERIAAWTEGVDEFGMLLLAVCTATYGI